MELSASSEWTELSAVSGLPHRLVDGCPSELPSWHLFLSGLIQGEERKQPATLTRGSGCTLLETQIIPNPQVWPPVLTGTVCVNAKSPSRSDLFCNLRSTLRTCLNYVSRCYAQANNPVRQAWGPADQALPQLVYTVATGLCGGPAVCPWSVGSQILEKSLHAV